MGCSHFTGLISLCLNQLFGFWSFLQLFAHSVTMAIGCSRCPDLGDPACRFLVISLHVSVDWLVILLLPKCIGSWKFLCRDLQKRMN